MVESFMMTSLALMLGNPKDTQYEVQSNQSLSLSMTFMTILPAQYPSCPLNTLALELEM